MSAGLKGVKKGMSTEAARRTRDFVTVRNQSFLNIPSTSTVARPAMGFLIERQQSALPDRDQLHTARSPPGLTVVGCAWASRVRTAPPGDTPARRAAYNCPFSRSIFRANARDPAPLGANRREGARFRAGAPRPPARVRAQRQAAVNCDGACSRGSCAQPALKGQRTNDVTRQTNTAGMNAVNAPATSIA